MSSDSSPAGLEQTSVVLLQSSRTGAQPLGQRPGLPYPVPPLRSSLRPPAFALLGEGHGVEAPSRQGLWLTAHAPPGTGSLQVDRCQRVENGVTHCLLGASILNTQKFSGWHSNPGRRVLLSPLSVGERTNTGKKGKRLLQECTAILAAEMWCGFMLGLFARKAMLLPPTTKTKWIWGLEEGTLVSGVHTVIAPPSLPPGWVGERGSCFQASRKLITTALLRLALCGLSDAWVGDGGLLLRSTGLG